MVYAAPQHRSAAWLAVAAALAARDGGYVCHYCRREMDQWTLTIDHKHPKSKGGADTLDNKVLACQPCNARKHDMDYDDFVRYGTYLRFIPHECCGHLPAAHRTKREGRGCLACTCTAFFH